jgi:hypothetical protein
MRLLILSTIVTLFWLQTALQQQQTASVEGIVVRAGTGAPIPEVQVKLTGVSSEIVLLTDSDGKFVFTNVPSGPNHHLSFALNGFVRKQYGQRSAFGSGIPFDLDAGKVMKGLVVSMTPTGSVDGRITDERGQPMEGIQVRLMRQFYSEHGEVGFEAAGTTRTNDRGQYRLYWVSPGRYSVSAEPVRFQPVRVPGDAVSTNSTENVGYVGSYYPGTTDSSRALPIEVKPGLEVGNIDWSLHPESAESGPYRIRGRVIDSRTGQPPRAVSISLSNRAGGGSTTTSSAYRGPDGPFGLSRLPGTFVLSRVTPGTYWVGAATDSAGYAGRLSAQTSVVVSDRDVDGVTLTIIPQFDISGRIRTEGFPVETLYNKGIRAALEWVGASSPYDATPVNAIANDTFPLFRLSPGSYRLSVSSLPTDYYVKEARLGQTDILGQTIEIGGPVSGTLDVLISNRSGLIEGTVVDTRQQPVALIEVVLIPDTQRNRPDLYRRVTADINGRFTIRGIPPGNYRLYAWEEIEPYAYFDPEVVQQVESQGKAVRVTELSKETVEIRSIP